MVEIYGKLEQIANELEPERGKILYFIGTLKSKHTPEEIFECVQNRTKWINYTGTDIESMIYSVTKSSQNNFFSSLEKRKPNEWKFNKGYVRTVASCEIALDIDNMIDFQKAVQFFRRHNLKGNCRTWEGARGGHVSLFFSEVPSESFKRVVRVFFNGDKGQVNISVEGKAHQKTGNVVEVITENKGFNTMSKLNRIMISKLNQ